MKLLLALAAGLFAVTACAPTPVVSLHENGWSVPALFAPDQLGNSLSLKNRTSGSWAIVFFYPEADTSG